MEIMTYQETVESLIKIKDKCESRKEYNLEFYCDCFIRMLRAYHKTEQGEMLSYVRDILKPAFPLVVRHFLERVNVYFEREENRERVEIMRDIEESVIEFDHLFDAIVRSTNHADRILFQTAPMDTTMRYVPPKLCMYYSLLLSGYAELFDGAKHNEYAFCVYPSLNQMAEAHILFQTRQKSGKVCVIRVPARQFANVKMIRIWLLHEMFHVLPSEELRLRKKRQTSYLKVLLYDLEWRILKNCDTQKFAVSRDEVRQFLIMPVVDRIRSELRKREGDERVVYSEPLKRIYVEEILNQLYEIQNDGQERFVSYMLEKSSGENVFGNMSMLADIRENFVQIRSNIYLISSREEVRRACDFYMNIFRESFADLFTVITLHLSREDYFNALETCLWRECGRGSGYQRRRALLVRAAFVVNAMNEEYMGTQEDEALFEQWRKSEVNENEGLLYEVEQFRKGMSCQEDEKTGKDILSGRENLQEAPVPIILNNKMREGYEEYFVSCCRSYLKFRKEHAEKLRELNDSFMIKDDITALDICSCAALCDV